MLVCTDGANLNANSAQGVDFCGIISLTGKVVFRFPVKQHSPDTLLRLVGINGSGSYAEVYVGRRIDGEDGPEVGEPREVLGWRYPNTLKKHPGPWNKGAPKDISAAYEEIRRGFMVREKQN